MQKLLQKGILLLLCFFSLLRADGLLPSPLDKFPGLQERQLLLILITIIISLLSDLLGKRGRELLYLLFALALAVDPGFLYFLPLVIYNAYDDFGIRLFPLFFLFFLYPGSFLPAILSGLSVYFRYQEHRIEKLQEENHKISDDFRERLMQEELSRRRIESEKVKDIEIAVLRERNRIAREIHDSIGHTLSSSILQVEALKLSFSDEMLIGHLENLQKTLDSGMLDIRQSLHHLHNSSLALEEEIRSLIEKQGGLSIRFSFQAEENGMDYAMKYAILSVVKEALTNIRKHSNAKKVEIRLIEHPSFYAFSIKDDGSLFSGGQPSDRKGIRSFQKGIGIRSMEETAKRWRGYVNFEFQDGFLIHLVLKKEDFHEGYNHR